MFVKISCAKLLLKGNLKVSLVCHKITNIYASYLTFDQFVFLPLTPLSDRANVNTFFFLITNIKICFGGNITLPTYTKVNTYRSVVLLLSSQPVRSTCMCCCLNTSSTYTRNARENSRRPFSEFSKPDVRLYLL